MGQALRFGLVGVAATLTHFGVAVTAVRWGAIAPQIANLIGFAVAFGVSFAGQWLWTFAPARTPIAHALPCYLAVSVGGFVANAAAYAALLRLTPLRYDVALALVLIVVAAATFLLSRRWVFKPQGRA
jgi:putative flippase GtrA